VTSTLSAQRNRPKLSLTEYLQRCPSAFDDRPSVLLKSRQLNNNSEVELLEIVGRLFGLGTG